MKLECLGALVSWCWRLAIALNFPAYGEWNQYNGKEITWVGLDGIAPYSLTHTLYTNAARLSTHVHPRDRAYMNMGWDNHTHIDLMHGRYHSSIKLQFF